MKESQLVNRMYEDYKKDHVVKLTDQDILESMADQGHESLKAEHSKSGIIVKGIYDVAVHFSR